MNLKRIKEGELKKLMAQFPAVSLIGPRQSGKTTLAKQLIQKHKNEVVYIDLESPSDIRKMNDPELLFTQNPSVNFIIDEVQRMPELFAILRSVIDSNKRPGRFLLLGSASPDLVKGASESLAGRIYSVDINPFNLLETATKNRSLQRHWFRGGFPDAYLSKSDEMWYYWINGFTRTFIERDLNLLFGTTFSSTLMFKLWRMLAHHHSGIWNAQSFAKGLDVSSVTINRYLDYLEGAFMVRKLPAYHFNTRKRLVKSPKVYLRDSGLLHFLLDIHQQTQLSLHPSIGHSWEGYAIEQIVQLLPPTIQAYYYRTQDGSEMDLVLVKGIQPIACIELKYASNPKLSRGTTESVKDLDCTNNFIVIPEGSTLKSTLNGFKIRGLEQFLSQDLKQL